MSRTQKRTADFVQGRGYVSRWNDGTLGWMMPEHLDDHRSAQPPSRLFNENGQPDDRAVLCEITVRVIRDSKGREITRRPRKAAR